MTAFKNMEHVRSCISFLLQIHGNFDPEDEGFLKVNSARSNLWVCRNLKWNLAGIKGYLQSKKKGQSINVLSCHQQINWQFRIPVQVCQFQMILDMLCQKQWTWLQLPGMPFTLFPANLCSVMERVSTRYFCSLVRLTKKKN